jgi:predicted acyltransferase
VKSTTAGDWTCRNPPEAARREAPLPPSEPAGRFRLAAIDQFRGFAILAMVVADYLAGVQTAPAWLKHAPDTGLTIVDLVAPLFIFAIGLTFPPSARRRSIRGGWKRTAEHFVRRYLVLIGIGALMSALSSWYGAVSTWGVLQAIGVAGLLTLPFIALPPGWRLGIGLGLLSLYQFLLDRFWLQPVLLSPHGGLPGSLGWGSMLILSTVLADLDHGHGQPQRALTLVAALTLLLGAALSVVVVISKHRVSASYVLVGLGVSALLYACFQLLDRLGVNVPLLDAWGANPLLLYILHYLLIGIYFLPGIPGWYTRASGWLMLVQILFLIAALSAIAVWFKRKKWIFSI